jgi:hypothetical protein
LSASVWTDRRPSRFHQAAKAGDRQGVDQPRQESACRARFSGSSYLSQGALAGRLHSPLQQQRRATLAYLLSGALGQSLLLVVAAVGGQQESRPL